jgi:hypothetical protein
VDLVDAVIAALEDVIICAMHPVKVLAIVNVEGVLFVLLNAIVINTQFVVVHEMVVVA